MIISELIKDLEEKLKEYGDIEVETRPYEELVLVIEGKDIEPKKVEYVPITNKTSLNPNAKKFGLELNPKSIIKRE